MKKILSIAAIGLAICGLFVGCASTGGSAKAAEGPGIPHPRSYDVDPGAVVQTLEIGYNQWGPNYQAVADFWKLLKKNKPEAGDTVNVKMKFTSDMDIPGMAVFLLDNGAPSYWTPISDDYHIENIKAGEPVVFEESIPLLKKANGGFQIVFAYNGADHGQDKYAKAANQAANFTFEQIGEMTDTEAEMAAAGAAPAGPKTINIAIDKIAAYCEIATNHPWVNGVQDMSQIENYANTVSIESLLDDVVAPGDVLNITWHGVSNMDIPVIYVRPVDHSQSVGWWNELMSFNKDEFILAENIKAGEPFTVSKTFVLEKGSETTDVILNVWYDYDPETNGPGPCTILMARD